MAGSIVTCQSCGAGNAANYIFCGSCGQTRVIDMGAPRGAGAAAPPAPPPAPFPPAYPVQASVPGPIPAPAPPPSSPAASTGSLVDIHSGYRSGRMNHEPPDELASSQVTLRTLRPHFFRFVMFFVVENILGILLLVFSVIAAITGGASSLLSNSPYGGNNGYGTAASSGGSFFGTMATVIGFLMLVVVVAWFVSLFLPMREPVAEYGALLEGRAGAARAAFDWIRRTARIRQSPLQITDASSGQQNLLVFGAGLEQAAVLVTVYGADLYLGWTMWRRRSTVMVVFHALRDMLETLRGGAYASDVRLGRTRAFRELVHSLTREGVQVAILSGTP